MIHVGINTDGHMDGCIALHNAFPCGLSISAVIESHGKVLMNSLALLMLLADITYVGN